MLSFETYPTNAGLRPRSYLTSVYRLKKLFGANIDFPLYVLYVDSWNFYSDSV